MELQELIARIKPADKAAEAACLRRWDLVAKPLNSLGKLESLLARAAAVTGCADPDLDKKCVLVFCADNGVLAQGVAQSTHDVTTAIARSLAAGTTSVSAMSKAAGADVFPVDMGMIDTVPGLLPRKIANGTNDLSQGPAMTREQAVQAILTGVELVKEKKEAGYNLIATGEAGIGNTTSSSAMAAVLLDLPVETVTGRGSGLSNEGLLRKQNAIRSGIAVNKPDPKDPLDVLSKVGGFDIAAMTGAFLGGALYHVPVIIDGLISSVAALCAARLCPAVRDYLISSNVTAEPAGKLIMAELGLSPMLHGDLRLGEGTGAVALFPMLDMASAVYRNAASFAGIQVEAYTKQV